MRTVVYRPPGEGPFPVLLYAHGRSGDALARSKLTAPIALGHVRYWLSRGYAVVAPVRPGYGETGGADVERTGVRYSDTGQCLAHPDRASATAAAMRAQGAALDWVRTQPWARADRILLEGQSAGGLATIGLCAGSPAGVVGCINFAGGTGGDPQRAPGRVCAPEQLEDLFRRFGATTRVPSIWLYADNDLYWGAEHPRRWHAGHAAGGSPSAFVATPPLPDRDGHQLLLRGGRMWSVPLDDWLHSHGFLP